MYPHRFWWRDTRLSELPPPRPPTVSVTGQPGDTYKFPYPITLAAVAYHLDLSTQGLLSNLIPRARIPYSLPISIPSPDAAMHIEGTRPEAQIRADGLLLYVAQAIYEPGTSPLSLWVPAEPSAEEGSMSVDKPSALDTFERFVFASEVLVVYS